MLRVEIGRGLGLRKARLRRELTDLWSAANLGGAFFGAMPAGGGTSQTAVVRSESTPARSGTSASGGLNSVQNSIS